MEFDPKQKSRRAADAVRAVLGALTKQVVDKPPDDNSSDYRPAQHDVEDTRTGFDANGDFHRTSDPAMYQRWLDHTSEWRHSGH